MGGVLPVSYTHLVNFKTTKHFRDKHNHYVDRSQWHITENVHEPIISRSDFETVQRILENASVRRPNGDGEIHPLSGLLFCKDCGAKMHIRIDYRNGGKRHVAYCSEYHKGKAKNPKCHSPHIMDADLLMQTIAEVLKKIEDYSISNRAEFEVLVKKNLAMQQTDQSKKQQKRIPQITTRLEQIDKVLKDVYKRQVVIPWKSFFAAAMQDIFGRQLKSVIRNTASIRIGRICMLKIRLQGTTNDIKWFKKILERDKRINVLDVSEPYANKGTKKYFRVYAEVEKNRQ